MKNIVNLGNVATYINGYAFKPSDWAEDGTPIIRIQDLTGNSYQMNRFKGIVDSKYDVNSGDVLISWSASLGVYVWNRGNAVLNQHIFKVVFDKEEVDKDFFVFQIDNLLKRAANQAHGATMRHLTKPVFDALPFYLPDIKTQRLISSKLNLIVHLIENHHEQLKKLDELIRSRFLEMFGMSEGIDKHLEDVADICSGITKGRKVLGLELREVPYMAVSNVKMGYIDLSTVKTIMATENEIEQYRLFPNDILMTEGGDPDKVGRGAIIRNPPKDCIHQNHIFRVRLHKDVLLPEFFEEYLQGNSARRYFLKAAKQTTGIASINMKQLRALPVKIPPIKVQIQYSDFVHQVDKSKMAVQKSLDELEILKKSLMQTYFG